MGGVGGVLRPEKASLVVFSCPLWASVWKWQRNIPTRSQSARGTCDLLLTPSWTCSTNFNAISTAAASLLAKCDRRNGTIIVPCWEVKQKKVFFVAFTAVPGQVKWPCSTPLLFWTCLDHVSSHHSFLSFYPFLFLSLSFWHLLATEATRIHEKEEKCVWRNSHSRTVKENKTK